MPGLSPTDALLSPSAVPEVSLQQEALGWRAYRPSAGYDTTFVGRAGLQGLVGISTAASLLNLSNAQALNVRKALQVAATRALEADRVVGFLQDDANGTGVVHQISGGKGFGSGQAPAGGTAFPDPLAALSAAGGAAGAGTLGAVAQGGNLEAADMDAYYTKEALERTVAFTREALREAAYLADSVSKGNRTAKEALDSAAQELNYPGLPPEALLKSTSLKNPVSRPRDTAPAWLDFLFSTDLRPVKHPLWSDVIGPPAWSDPYRDVFKGTAAAKFFGTKEDQEAAAAQLKEDSQQQMSKEPATAAPAAAVTS